MLSETEVCKMLEGLSPRKSTGLDDLPAICIRDGAEGIAYPISYIINLSLKSKKATGLDDLPARFIRDGAEGIASPISYIINLSLKNKCCSR